MFLERGAFVRVRVSSGVVRVRGAVVRVRGAFTRVRVSGSSVLVCGAVVFVRGAAYCRHGKILRVRGVSFLVRVILVPTLVLWRLLGVLVVLKVMWSGVLLVLTKRLDVCFLAYPVHSHF